MNYEIICRLPMYALTFYLSFLVFRQAVEHPITSCSIAFAGGTVAGLVVKRKES